MSRLVNGSGVVPARLSAAGGAEAYPAPHVTTRVADSPWLTAADAARYLRRGKRFVLAQIKAGRLRAARIGGRGELLTRREWLDAFVESETAVVMVAPRAFASCECQRGCSSGSLLKTRPG